MTTATPFSNPQHQQKIEELVAIAKEQGYITYEEINEILPMTFDSPEQIDQVLIFLSGMDIQVLNQAEVERQKERKKEAKELEGLPKRSRRNLRRSCPDVPQGDGLRSSSDPRRRSRDFQDGSKKRRSRSKKSSCASAIRRAKRFRLPTI